MTLSCGHPRRYTLNALHKMKNLLRQLYQLQESSGGCVYFLNSWRNGTHTNNAPMFSAHLSTHKVRKKTAEDGVTVVRTRVEK